MREIHFEILRFDWVVGEARFIYVFGVLVSPSVIPSMSRDLVFPFGRHEIPRLRPEVCASLNFRAPLGMTDFDVSVPYAVTHPEPR